MRVKNRQTEAVVEATKISDTTYRVEGKEVSKEDMAKLYVPVKEVSKPKQSQELQVVDSESDMGGDIGALAGALAKCQGEFTGVKKGTSGHGYDYADLEAVIASSSPITSKNGIAVSQLNTSKLVGDILLVGVKTILMHSKGGYIMSSIYVPAVKTKMNSLVQMSGLNISYLRRYGLQSALGLATTDSDGAEK